MGFNLSSSIFFLGGVGFETLSLVGLYSFYTTQIGFSFSASKYFLGGRGGDNGGAGFETLNIMGLWFFFF
jgi:hypothetical protein